MYFLYSVVKTGCGGRMTIPHKFTILSAEDNEHDMLAIQKTWSKLKIKHPLIQVRDGETCLDFLHKRGEYKNRSSNEQPGLLLLDIRLPKKDGFEVLQSIRKNKNLSALPVIMFTNSANAEDCKRSYALGANAYIRKPGNFKTFSEMIQNICQFWSQVDLPEEVYESF